MANVLNAGALSFGTPSHHSKYTTHPMPSNFTAPHPKSSSDAQRSAGMLSLTAIAAIGNCRSIPRAPKSIVVDAQIFVGSPSCESLLGALQYYNTSNLAFHEDTVGLYLINTSVSFWTEYDRESILICV